MNAVVERAITLFEASARARGVEIARELAERLPLIAATETQLCEALRNLADNAIDAMPDGGRMTLSTRPSPTYEGGVEIAVRDTGVGISDEVRGKIFDPFFTTKDVGKGTGLGLAVVYEIVQRHGGRVEVESKPGHGSTFTVTLPAASRGPDEPPE